MSIQWRLTSIDHIGSIRLIESSVILIWSMKPNPISVSIMRHWKKIIANDLVPVPPFLWPGPSDPAPYYRCCPFLFNRHRFKWMKINRRIRVQRVWRTKWMELTKNYHPCRRRPLSRRTCNNLRPLWATVGLPKIDPTKCWSCSSFCWCWLFAFFSAFVSSWTTSDRPWYERHWVQFTERPYNDWEKVYMSFWAFLSLNHRPKRYDFESLVPFGPGLVHLKPITKHPIVLAMLKNR